MEAETVKRTFFSALKPNRLIQPRNIDFAVFITIFVICRILCCWIMPLYDDAFITLRYSDNLIEGKGFIYNPGSRVLGTTTPLFAAILSVFGLIGFNLIVAARLVGLVCEFLTLWLLRGILSESFGRNGWLILSALVLFDPYMSRISVGGMETWLFLAVTIWSLKLIIKSSSKLSLSMSAVSVWLRAEGIISLLVNAVEHLRRKRTLPMREILPAAVILIFPAMVLFLYYGSPISQSVIAKSNAVGRSFFHVFNWFLGLNKDPLQAVLTVTMLISLPFVIKRSTFLRLFGIWCGLYLLGYFIARPQIWSWYALPVYFFKCTVTACGASLLINRFRVPDKLKRSVGYTAMVIPLLLWVYMGHQQGESQLRKNIEKPLKEFCGVNIARTDTVYAHDIGMIGYYSGAIILDHFGLVWLEYKRYESWKEILTELKPQWGMLVMGVHFKEFLSNPELTELYQPIVRFSELGERAIPTDTTLIQGGWSHDYVLIKRKIKSVVEY